MRRVVVPAAVLALLVLAALAGASPQPTPVCPFCDDRFEDEAGDLGVNATVVESRVTVQVHENGTATWTVRNRLSDGADRFRSDPSRLAAVGRAMAEEYLGDVGAARFRAARMDGDTAVLVYRDPGAAERHAGLLVLDYLHHGGYVPWYVVNAEEFTVRGPPGTVVSNDPGTGEVDGRAVTWRGTTEGKPYEAPDLDGAPYVVFGPDDTPATDARTSLAVLLASLPLAVDGVLLFVVVQSLVFAGVLGAVVVAVRWREPDVGVGPLVAAVAVPAGIGGAPWVAQLGPEGLPGFALFGVLLAGLAWDGRTRPYLRTPRAQGVVAAGILVVSWVVTAATYAATGTLDAPTPAATRFTALVLPVAAMLPLGGALRADGNGRYLWAGTAVLAFVATPPLLVNFAAPLSGVRFFLLVLGFFLLAILYPVLGTPVVLLGDRLSATDSPGATDARRRDDA